MRTKLRLTCRVVAGLVTLCGSSHGLAGEADPVLKRLESSPRHHEWVTIETQTGRKVRAFLVFPEVSRPVPGVLVIHENRGLTDWVRGVADQLAEAGYVALAPDLLSQTGPDNGGTESFPSSDAARDGIYKLPPEQVLADLDACVTHLQKLDATNRSIVVSGFCWGGTQSFRFATHSREIRAAFVFYGSAPTEAEQLERIRVPVYGFYGGNDFRITSAVPKTVELMKELDKPYEPVTYEGAGHAFMRSGEGPDADPANRDARKQAWEKWTKILSRLDDRAPATREAANDGDAGR